MKLDLYNVSCGYKKKEILKDINFSLGLGEIYCILGPNGVGKTTLFKTILGILPTLKGDIKIDNKDIKKLDKKCLAKLIAYVPQSHEPPFSFKVIDVVLTGRTAHIGFGTTPKKLDYDLAYEALKSLNIYYLKDSLYTEISGGERQLVLIARALVQKSKFIILDEPTSNLDFGNQLVVLDEIKKLKSYNYSIVMITHTPDHAFICNSKVILIKKDKSLVFGTNSSIITEENIFEAYGIKSKIAKFEYNQNIYKTCIPIKFKGRKD